MKLGENLKSTVAKCFRESTMTKKEKIVKYFIKILGMFREV